jgi:hypothetical protein
MAMDDRDPRPRSRSAPARQLSYRSRRIATPTAEQVDLDDITAAPTAGHTGGRPVISGDGVILNTSSDAASPARC